MAILAAQFEVGEEFEEMVANGRFGDEFESFLLLDGKFFLEFLLLLPVLELFLPALVGDGDLAELVVLMLEQHLLLSLLLRKHHIEAIVVEVVPNAVRVPVYYPRVHLPLHELLLIPLLFDLLLLQPDPSSLQEGLIAVEREAADDHVLALIVLVACQLL